jgi:hypothetical protein
LFASCQFSPNFDFLTIADLHAVPSLDFPRYLELRRATARICVRTVARSQEITFPSTISFLLFRQFVCSMLQFHSTPFDSVLLYAPHATAPLMPPAGLAAGEVLAGLECIDAVLFPRISPRSFERSVRLELQIGKRPVARVAIFPGRLTVAGLRKRAEANGWIESVRCHVVQLGPLGKERVIGDGEELAGIRNPVAIEEAEDAVDGAVWGIVSGLGMADAVVRLVEGECFGAFRERQGIGSASARFKVGGREIGDGDAVAELLTEPGGRLELAEIPNVD